MKYRHIRQLDRMWLSKKKKSCSLTTGWLQEFIWKCRLTMPNSVKVWEYIILLIDTKWGAEELAKYCAYIGELLSLFNLPLDPRICTLTPNGHLELGALSGSRGSYSSERRSFTIESRKSSVMSLGKSSLERRSLSLVRSHTYFIYWPLLCCVRWKQDLN